MVNIKRNLPAPDGLSKWDFVGVKQALIDMFYNKCYLCEQKNPISTEIEHFKSKSIYPELMYEWRNLFLACHHCNSVKNYTIDKSALDIINCTNNNPIITNEINFISEGSPKESIKIVAMKEDISGELANTILLLNNIFNAKTEGKSFDSKNLTDQVIKEVHSLITLIHEYYYNVSAEARKAEILSKVKDTLSIASPFTAFKICYIKNRSNQFSELLDLLPSF